MSNVAVETFEVIERGTGEAAPEMEAEAVELIEELDLEGQKSILQTDPETDVQTRIPYRKMTVEERRVYETLCPEKTSLRKFSDEALPLRVLQVLSHAKEFFSLDEIQIWHRATEVKDPVAVARVDRNEYHLLCRWGSELLPFPDLREKAEEVKRRDYVATCEDKIAEAKSFLASVDAKVRKYFNGDWVSTP